MPTQPSGEQARPIAFMVMPFRKRAVPQPPEGAPTQIDFDALWDRVYAPVLRDLGYDPIRADGEVGSVILKDMFERLKWSDLVLADLTLPNGNVYYEVGLRHVAERTHCVLVAADWSTQLFDVAQIRTVRYPLTDGNIGPAAAEAIREVLRAAIPKMEPAVTPFHSVITTKEAAATFRAQLAKLGQFQEQARAIRLAGSDADCAKEVEALRDAQGAQALQLPEVSLELLTLIRDHVGWEEALAFIETLPEALQQRGFVREQRALAQSKIGDAAQAIAALERLIKEEGETPERLGLLGGRHKRRWREARDEREASGAARPSPAERRALNAAIDAYRTGMELDYNAYYCASNLPNLLRSRGKPGDAEEAHFIDQLVVRTCERAIERGTADEWVRPTLLGAAFRAQDVEKAEELADLVEEEGAARWKLDTTLHDLEEAVKQAPAEKQPALQGLLDRLRGLL